MAIELGDISLDHLTYVAVSERARIVSHPVPGMSGSFTQVLGRPSVEVAFHGIFYGERAADDLQQLRQAHLAGEPLDFFAEAVGEGYFAQVLITGLEVAQRAGYLDQFDFRCQVVEYVEPPEPAATSPLGALDTSLVDEAAAFVDDVQNALAQVSQLVDIIGSIPSFGDPTEKLPAMLSSYTTIVDGGAGVLAALRDLF